MSQRTIFIVTLLVSLVSTGMLFAQDDSDENAEEKSFNLHHEGSGAQAALLEEEEKEAFEPRLEAGIFESTVSLGFMNLNTTLLDQKQIIYRYEDEATYWGDVALTGESAFNPMLRCTYGLKKWLAVEATFGMSFSKYYGSITNQHSKANEPDASVDPLPPVLGEFDAETRSMVTTNVGVGIMYYLFDHFSSNSEGRFHPYVCAGVGQIWYGLDSNYTDTTCRNSNLFGGAGLRIIADKILSIRLEMTYCYHDLSLNSAENFDVLNEGTLEVPLQEYRELDDGSYMLVPVESFESNTISALGWQLGVVARF